MLLCLAFLNCIDLECTCIGARTIDDIRLISNLLSVLSDRVLCLLTLELFDGASLFDFAVSVALVRTYVVAGGIDCVSFITLWRFVLSNTV